MNKLIFSIIFVLSSSAFANKYKIDTAHTMVGFKVKHLVVSTVSGRFDKFDGDFDFKEGKVSNINVKIDLDSINTNEKKRDDHLRSPDFFGVRDAKKGLVKKRQFMTFVSSGDSVSVGDNNITGKLTIGDVTKDVTLKVNYGGEATDPWGNKRVGFTASGKINRKDFNVNWSKTLDGGGLVVADDVDIVIESEAIAQK